MGAANMQSLSPMLTRNHVRLVGIGLEVLGYQDFVKVSRWREVLAVDPDHKLYHAFGTIKHDWTTFAGIIGTVPVFASWASRASKLGYHGNTEGNKTQFGGTFAFDATGKCVYAHRQDATKFEPDVPAMLSALRLPEADVAQTKKRHYPSHEEIHG
jgi:hypothetical protein